MPELAEVERGRRLLENAILDKKIIEVLTTEDALVFVDDAASILEKSLPGRTVLAVKRHGKNIYLKVDGQGPTLAFHLGMTGSVVIKDGEFHYRRPRYIKRISSSWPPWRWKILLKMDDGTEVCTVDTSRFGRVRAVDAEDALSIPPLSLLAPDAWLNLPSSKDLGADLACRTAPIKTVLLDQKAAVSGLGNYNVDEILFQARIHPRQPSYTLDGVQTEALHSAIKLVAAKVMEVDADTKKLPKTWLYRHRYGRKSGIGQAFVMEDGASTQVTHDRINARITALTDVQVLCDYSHIPLPKRRMRTAVDLEGDGDGSSEDGASINGLRAEHKHTKRKQKGTVAVKDPEDPARPSTKTNAEKKDVPLRRAKRQRRTNAASVPWELVEISDRGRRSSARLREKKGL